MQRRTETASRFQLRNRHFLLLDLVLMPSAAILAFALRLDPSDFQQNFLGILYFAAVAVPVQLLANLFFGIYKRYWQYASVDDLLAIAAAAAAGSVAVAGIVYGVLLPVGRIWIPRSIPLINGLLVLLLTGGIRFAARVRNRSIIRRRKSDKDVDTKRVLIAGAGEGGILTVREIAGNPQLGLVPVGFLDDDPEKIGLRISGLPVLGDRNSLEEIAAALDVSEVIIAMPTAPAHTVRQIVELCAHAGVSARTIPGMYDIVAGNVSIDLVREVDIADLMRRQSVQVDSSAVEEFIRGRRVMITGAGGSIGSELCRQIVRARPQKLVLLGHGENSIFGTMQQLRRSTVCELVPAIADVRDSRRLAHLFSRHRPEIVFHAAAHKHVPLMEANLCEAITNNVVGTRNLLRVSEQFDVSHFILISTDKAVNPTSAMGVTKRIAELLVYDASNRNGGCYSAVRFGNVLDSRGSVLRTFRQQIAKGGPITVTHPEMCRYFMTIPEAVLLVLQAAAIGHGGEVFVLDMGEPVRIVDLATDLALLSGLRPRILHPETVTPPLADRDWDVDIVFVGSRPGEKLREDLFFEGEECRRTAHESILVAEHDQLNLKAQSLQHQVDQLEQLANESDELGLLELLREIVPQYQPYQTTTVQNQAGGPNRPVPSPPSQDSPPSFSERAPAA